MTNSNQKIFEMFSRKNSSASKNVPVVVTTCESDAKVPVDCVSPKNRNKIKKPEAKTPTKKINFHEEKEIFLTFFIKSFLK